MANLREVAKAVEQRAARKFARATVDLPLPIYEGQYVGRFGILEGERLAELERLGEGATEYSREQAAEAAADLIAESCRQILARSEPGGPFETLTHDDGRPVRFDKEFAEALELDPIEGGTLDSMASVVLACWRVDDGKLSDPALNTFAIRLLTFMQDTSRHVEGELAGE